MAINEYNSTGEKITDKDEIVRRAVRYLKNNSLIDMNGFIHEEMNYPEANTGFIRDVAYQMWGEGLYDFADTYKRDEYLLIEKQGWLQRHPVRYSIWMLVVSGAVGLLFSILKDLKSDQSKCLQDIKQDSLIFELERSVGNLQTTVQQNQHIEPNISKKKKDEKPLK